MEPMKLHINQDRNEVLLRDSDNSQYTIEKSLQPILQAIEEHRGKAKKIEIFFCEKIDTMRSNITQHDHQIGTFSQRHALTAALISRYDVPIVAGRGPIKLALVGSATKKNCNGLTHWFPSQAIYPHAVELRRVKYGHVALAAASIEDHLNVKCEIVDNDLAEPLNQLNKKFNQNKMRKLLSWCNLVVVFGKDERKYRQLTNQPIIQFN